MNTKTSREISKPTAKKNASSPAATGSNAKVIAVPVKRIEDYSYELRIPRERIAVLIGKSGEVKKRFEIETSTKINVDSKEGDVAISGNDPIKLFSMREVIRAIGRGFNPDIAQLLMKTDYCFEIINLGETLPSKNDMIRVKGRIIGAEGKSRKIIEEMTHCYICVYGKTVSIIGSEDTVPIARRAIEMLLRGSMHSSVYKWLEKKVVDMKRKELLGEDLGLKPGMEKYIEK